MRISSNVILLRLGIARCEFFSLALAAEVVPNDLAGGVSVAKVNKNQLGPWELT